MMKGFLICLFLCCSFQVSGQDLIARKAPVDRKMKIVTDKSHQNVSVEEDDELEVCNFSVIVIDNDDDWKWLSEEEPDYKTDTYPIFLNYYYYPSHPQYKEVGYHVYDNNGRLVRAANPCSKDANFLREEVGEALLLFKAAIDYKNNKYNFKKENVKAQNHVKMVLGLINVPDKDRLKYFDVTGAAYINQLKSDHYNDFRVIMKSERTSNLSFKITIGDEDWNPIATYSVTYRNKGKFNSSIKIQEIALEHLDRSEYKTTESGAPNHVISNGVSSEIRYHKVKKDETVSSIARKCGISVEELCRMNRIGKNTQLKLGQILRVRHIKEGQYQQENTPDASAVNEPLQKPNETTVKTKEPFDYDKVHDVVEVMPMFAGGSVTIKSPTTGRDSLVVFEEGYNGLKEYLRLNVKYPVTAEENGIQGRVICSFVVGRDGQLTDIKPQKSVDPSLDKEAIRVISSMPKWKPGTQDGKPVAVRYVIPVTFRLR